MGRVSDNESSGSLKVLLVEPFYGGAHKIWADRIRAFSRHSFEFLTLEGKYWKWRMRGGSVLLAREYLKLEETPDLILSTSMLDLSSFLGMIAKGGAKLPPILHYCHENQLLYPVPEENKAFKEQRNSFGAIEWRSILIADRVIFNSEFHKNAAIQAFQDYVRKAPDHKEMDALDGLEARSSIYPPAPDLQKLKSKARRGDRKAILWNHRWEAEKGPKEFDRTVRSLLQKRANFDLILLGAPGSAEGVREKLLVDHPERVLFAGEADNEAYPYWVGRADLSLVHSQQDFFGLSVVEAIHAGVVPILPDQLAYPEHLTPPLKDLLYKEREEAERKALEVIDGERVPDEEELRHSVAPYDIREWIESFDKELEATARSSLR